jgi:hypothetical protein
LRQGFFRVELHKTVDGENAHVRTTVAERYNQWRDR